MSKASPSPDVENIKNNNNDLGSNNQYRSPLDQFRHNVDTHPDRICFVQPAENGVAENFSWRDVDRQVRCMAAYIDQQSLSPGSRIGILSSNCAHWIMADYAIWMAGHISVPLYPVLSANSIEQILEHSDTQFLFVGKLENWPAMQHGVADTIKRIHFPTSKEKPGESWSHIIDTTAPLSNNKPREIDELATIVYTSGTTGMPKGVMHSFRTLATVGTLTGKLYDTDHNDRMLSYLPLAHVAERAAVQVNQLYQGFTVYFTCSLETFADDLRRAQPTLFFAVPRIWLKLQQRVFEQVAEKKLSFLLKVPILSSRVRKKLTDALGMSSVRVGVSGAAPLSTSLMAWYQSLGIPLLEGYAMSENFAYSHSTQLGESKIGYVGTANPLVECKISDNDEIRIKSPSNMLGYYLEPDLSAAAFDNDGYLHTGDKGEIDAQGRLKITGRIKELFKTSKGKYVAPNPIEDLLSKSTALEQLCVTGPDLPSPLALVTLSESGLAKLTRENGEFELTAELETLLSNTNKLLDKHEQLSTIILFREQWTVENDLMTPTLKIKRANIEARYQTLFVPWQAKKDKVIFA